MSQLDVTQRQFIRDVIDRPEAVLMVRLRAIDNDNINDNNNNKNEGSYVAVANVHVWWSQLKYPALQALQVSIIAMSCLLLHHDSLLEPRCYLIICLSHKRVTY